MIQQVDPMHPHVALLLARLAQHNRARYGSEGFEDAPPEEWAAAFVAYQEHRPIGLIAVRPFAGDAHIVRLYVEPPARGRGLTMALGRAALNHARTAGYHRAVWDTGAELPEVLATSAHLGASEIPQFGAHKNSRLTRCFAVDLGMTETVEYQTAPAAAAPRPSQNTASSVSLTPGLPALPADALQLVTCAPRCPSASR